MSEFTISRRGLTGAVAGLSLAGSLSSAMAQNATPESETYLRTDLPSGGEQTDGTWAFTDDRGVTQTLDATPTVVVAHIGIAAALYDFGYTVGGYYGTAVAEDGSPLPSAGRLPLDEVPSIGDNAEINIEKLINLKAKVFIGPSYDLSLPLSIWPIDDEGLEIIDGIAKVIEIAYSDGTTVQRTIESIANLAAAFGADIATPEIEQSREEFETAVANLESALATKPDLSVAFISGSSTGYWESEGLADLNLFAEKGMSIVTMDTTSEQSWETFGQLEADLLMIDEREPGWWDREHLKADIPVFSLHPSVIAGNLGNWTNVYVTSFVGYTPILQSVTESVAGADEGIFS